MYPHWPLIPVWRSRSRPLRPSAAKAARDHEIRKQERRDREAAAFEEQRQQRLQAAKESDDGDDE